MLVKRYEVARTYLPEREDRDGGKGRCMPAYLYGEGRDLELAQDGSRENGWGRLLGLMASRLMKYHEGRR